MPRIKSDDKTYERRIKNFSRNISQRVNEFNRMYQKEAHSINKVKLRFLKEDLEFLTATYSLYYNEKNK
jgi:hypothetical protein